MKVLASILVVCATAFAVDPTKPPHIRTTTVVPVVNSTEVPALNATTVLPINGSTVLPVVNSTEVPLNSSTTVVPVSTPLPVKVPVKVREARFVSLVNGYVYDRAYDSVITAPQYYRAISQPLYRNWNYHHQVLY